ncbi:UNVERIFIED_CONTAM: hypothetical protein FKN15_069177 [Acipenser sinensis]
MFIILLFDCQIRQFAAVMVRMRVLKHWRKLAPDIKENAGEARDPRPLASTAQLPEPVNQERQPTGETDCGLLVLSKVMDSNPEPFKPHYKQLLKLFGTTLEDHGNTNAMFYSIQTLSAMAAFLGAEELVQASESMEVFDELMENEMPIIVPHVSEVVQFCLEAILKQKLLPPILQVLFPVMSAAPPHGEEDPEDLDPESDEIEDELEAHTPKHYAAQVGHTHTPPPKHYAAQVRRADTHYAAQVLFPVMSAAPPHGEEDPEDLDPEPDEIEDELEAHTPKHYAAQVGHTHTPQPKHYAAQVIDMLALHLPAEKLFNQLTPMTEAALCSENPYHRKAGLMCLAVLAEGCADHIRQKHLPAMLQVMCRSLGDESQVPDISKYSDELMPLLLNYLSGIDSRRGGHVTKAYYALENFVENLGDKIEPYLPTLMERMLTSLTCAQSIRIKELSVSAIGAIDVSGTKEMLLEWMLREGKVERDGSVYSVHLRNPKKAVKHMTSMRRSKGLKKPFRKIDMSNNRISKDKGSRDGEVGGELLDMPRSIRQIAGMARRIGEDTDTRQ